MNKIAISKNRLFIPIISGFIGSIFLAAVYFGIVSWAESFKHAVEFFWQDRWIVLPIILGFGIQVALYTIIKFKIFLPIGQVGLSGPSVGASGTTSTIAMVACCAHHLTDVLPILGLAAAATFLAKYRILFMVVGLGSTILGIAYMLFILIREKQKFIKNFSAPLISKELL
ncbi:MAG: hypothetical protein CVU42_11985 [Chloroflexi bacterium HGW-Chloroflexi-4]|jgi:hypothetical protein|nr:MAG: hypothetical protein CVU42_11985 [Chloroflexi bacterium HGW-Chloroflexi-4]